ncbi:invasion associated locus B family protein [Roseococcus sp. SDR]|uniref:invasion associated locus B family protein n=1 Tax=Roseococcus sp. SDR TaxID=2835532 RepID=UPI001BCD0449|nr:invasion associated locus B family protein [Roseococcus sp. SDR]MBS7792934.1 invasion associated locus B family protein [Roseococcus sp. SDR]MBV1848248.1 invasion associated locus B family protein [Roseococcus sp. SDR]
MRLSMMALAARLLAAPALAQAPAPAAAPNVTNASFGDWILRCETRQNGPRGCEVLQSLQDQRRQPVAQFAFGRAQRGDPMRLIVLIPANVTVVHPMLIQLPDRAAPIPVTLRACGPRGCVAETDVSAGQLTRLRAREAQGRLEYRDALGGEVALPFSTRGFGQALDALAREGF